MRIVVFGAGYVGLVSAAGFAEIGHEVLVVDVDEGRASALGRGEMPIYEPGLADLVRRSQLAGRLRFTSSIDGAGGCDLYFICVGTPALPDGGADVSAVLSAADAIAALEGRGGLPDNKNTIVAIKSTVPVGTCDRVEERLGPGFEVVSNPEFLKEGSALADFFKPDRVLVGARSDAAREVLRLLYAPLQLSGERILFMGRRSSELTKYASNTMLAMRVSFMNELSRLCHRAGADIRDVRLGVGSDSRIGKAFLHAGPGYGGSCFPKDVQALARIGREHGALMRLAEAAHLANAEQIAFTRDLVLAALGDEATGKTVAIWGLAFKPETDDVRESPALPIARDLISRGARVAAHDPEASANFARVVQDPGLRIATDPYDAASGADALVLLTEWRSYRAPDFANLKRRMRGSAVVDARNVWRRAEVERAGLRYQGIGTR
jgi:UDPglucose 6-dehydrogenase